MGGCFHNYMFLVFFLGGVGVGEMEMVLVLMFCGYFLWGILESFVY